MEFKEREFIPVALGGDINTYSVARAFYEQYQVKTYVFGKYPSGPSYNSKITIYSANPKNDEDEWEVDSSWLVRSDKFASTQSMNEGDMYSVISHTKEEQRYEEIEQEIEQEPEIDPNGYTQVELAKAIRDKKYQLKTLVLCVKLVMYPILHRMAVHS